MRAIISTATVFFIFLVAACDAPQAKEAGSDFSQIPITTAQAVGSEKMVAELEVKGMMCTQACGGKITKELLKLEGAKDVAIEFDENRATDKALVEFDPTQLSAEEMIACIHKIADGKLYSVQSVVLTQFTPEG